MPPSGSPREAIRLLALAGRSLAVAAAGYAPAIVACGVGFGMLGVWLRSNMHRLKP